jgi:cysteine desulfurase/selenocysteine lyase
MSATKTPARPDAVPYDVDQVRADFPILAREIHGKPLVYLDNAATTHKPRAVIQAEVLFYQECNANIHRGVHRLSQEATELFERARESVRDFLGAADASEIVFTRGTTESLNLVASSYGGSRLREGDEILITHMEHHSNIVPWQLLCERTGAKLKVAPITDAGELDVDAFASLLSDRTKIVSVVHVSNALGTVNPIRQLADLAHERGAVFVVDGAQAAPHAPVDVRALGADFYAISGHKMYGPTGVGALYGRADLLAGMPPYEGGGEMIRSVTFEKTTYADPPHRFEAGTPNIAGGIGLGAAVKYLQGVGLERIAAHEADLLAYGTEALREIPGLTLVGTAAEKAGVLSFVLDCAHPHDIGTILDHEAVAVRTGHHCAQPVMDRYGVSATARASVGLYNRRDEIDALAAALRRVHEVFA